MLAQAGYIESNRTYPYYNLALEEYLLDHVKEDEIILYLWQNANTVVIGRNQNSWKECKVSELEAAGGHLVRRLSGGGAVFHDLGNLNFTFLMPQDQFDLDRQLEVILQGLNKLGIHAVKSGRNDITVNGMKFSGNAFFNRNGHSYHHGTLMVDVVLSDLAKYLNVDREKLRSKAVESVRSRVTNLSEHHQSLTIELLKETLKESFAEVYRLHPQILTLDEAANESIRNREGEFASWEFKHGRNIAFQFESGNRFDWGDICMQFVVSDGRIQDTVIYSDAMKQDVILQITTDLKGGIFAKDPIIKIIGSALCEDETEAKMRADLSAMIRNLDL
ncbi:MAG: lipoate--protein ligase [Lachnospiraceae bacterium]